jgi:cell division protein ZapB
MTFELLEKLEQKINQAVETIALLQMEIEELKAEKANFLVKSEQLQLDNNRLNAEHQQWQDRLSALVGKIEKSEENAES